MTEGRKPRRASSAPHERAVRERRCQVPAKAKESLERLWQQLAEDTIARAAILGGGAAAVMAVYDATAATVPVDRRRELKATGKSLWESILETLRQGKNLWWTNDKGPGLVSGPAIEPADAAFIRLVEQFTPTRVSILARDPERAKARVWKILTQAASAERQLQQQGCTGQRQAARRVAFNDSVDVPDVTDAPAVLMAREAEAVLRRERSEYCDVIRRALELAFPHARDREWKVKLILERQRTCRELSWDELAKALRTGRNGNALKVEFSRTRERLLDVLKGMPGGIDAQLAYAVQRAGFF